MRDNNDPGICGVCHCQNVRCILTITGISDTVFTKPDEYSYVFTIKITK